MAEKAISDEQIVSALITSGTVKGAAAAAGCSTRTVYNRLHEDEFKALYLDARTDILRAAVSSMNEHLSSAVEAIAEIMTDTAANPAIRLQAAQTLLNNAGKYSDVLTAAEQAAEKAHRAEKCVDLSELIFGGKSDE